MTHLNKDLNFKRPAQAVKLFTNKNILIIKILYEKTRKDNFNLIKT